MDPIYFICLAVGFLFTLISAIGAHVFSGAHDVRADLGGSGADGHAEAGIESSDMPGFSPLSPTILSAFVTAFGGLGVIFSRIDVTRSPWVSTPLSILGGFVVAAIVLWLFRQLFRRTQSSSESKVAG